MVRMKSPGKYIARLAWYDRNPIYRLASYEAIGVAPHSITDRFTYTVPAGKKAMVEVLTAQAIRATAATTAGRAYTYITVNDGTTWYTLISAMLGLTNAVGDRAQHSLGASLMLGPGCAIRAQTVDLATGGSVDYFIALKVTEFDA